MNEKSRIEIQDGYYNAKPTCCGLTSSSKSGLDQFAIECALEVPQFDGTTKTIHMTKFCGLSTEPIPNVDGTQLEFTMRDAETCGCNVDLDIREWMIDPERRVRVKIVNDDYGPQLKSIFPEGGGSGGLIRKQAMDDARKAVVADKLNAQLRALRAKQKQASGDTTSAPKSTPRPAQQQRSFAPQQRPAQRQPQAPVPDDVPNDDDIPF